MVPGATPPIIVIGVTLFIVLLFNGLLILRIKSRQRNSDVELLESMIKSVKNPMKDSGKDYDELAQLLEKTKKRSIDEPRNSEKND